MKKIITIAAILAIAVACNKQEEPLPDSPFKDMVKLASAPTNQGATKIDVYMSENPFVGYNKVYIDVYDSLSGVKYTDWNVSIKPMMTMMMNGATMQHTCPTEQPEYVNEMNAYVGATVFIMPTSEMGSWNFELNYENDIANGSLSFSPTVEEKSNPALISFLSETNPNDKYFVALINPTTPDVGINDFEVGIYKKESMMSFPPVDGLDVSIAPEMPTMGHGSPDNVNPESIGNGHYKGSVNFTMTGLWHINMVIKESSTMIDESHYFAIEF